MMGLMFRTAVVVSTLASMGLVQPPSSRAFAKTIEGQVGYLGFDALPSRTNVHVYLNDTTSSTAGPQLVTEKWIVTGNEQAPIRFSLEIPNSSIHPKHTYSMCADISIMSRPKFVCDKPRSFQSPHWPKHVKLMLHRVR
jgi:uncharacterized lipoprotein YbaY